MATIYNAVINSSVYRDKKQNNSLCNISLTLPQINHSTTPAQDQGSLAYDPNTQGLYFSNGSSWTQIQPGSSGNLIPSASCTYNISFDKSFGNLKCYVRSK